MHASILIISRNLSEIKKVEIITIFSVQIYFPIIYPRLIQFQENKYIFQDSYFVLRIETKNYG